VTHDLPTRRLLGCVENWPDCYTGGYDPKCCRFPKSCSATVYDLDLFPATELEPWPGDTVAEQPADPNAFTVDDIARTFGVPRHLIDGSPRPPRPPRLRFPNPFADDPDSDRPMGSLWTVVACLAGAGLAFGAAVAAYRRMERGRQ
jgi:hypothetical protein